MIVLLNEGGMQRKFAYTYAVTRLVTLSPKELLCRLQDFPLALPSRSGINATLITTY